MRLPVLILLLVFGHAVAAPAPPDSVYYNAYVYTADPSRRVAQAVAVRGDEIVAVGDTASVLALAGTATERVDLRGRMMMPGLQDAHIHALGIVPGAGCDLDNRPLSLAELARFVADCDRGAPGGVRELLLVRQWNYAQGNAPAAGLRNLREALDAASRSRPIVLLGSDGHHGAANSLALARARAPDGTRIGLSAATLQSVFAGYREFVGVDAHGEPDGSVNEEARDLIHPATLAETIGVPADEDLPQVARLLLQSGITSILDPAATPPTLDLYRRLIAAGAVVPRIAVALYLDPREFRSHADGPIDVAAMVERAHRLRAEWSGARGLRIVATKLFVDGVLEGNPLADPPALPNAALVEPYLQPRFRYDAALGMPYPVGYVDTGSDICREVQAKPDAWRTVERRERFRARHGFLPAQCALGNGVLMLSESFVRDYVIAMGRDGFAVHAHAIGDRAVRVALAGFEAARAAGAEGGPPHTLVHAQLVHPADRRRIGAMGTPVVFTFAWAVGDPAYDMSVIPFIDRIDGAGGLYRPDGYYLRNAYPAASIAAAGGLVVAGSDAPVDTRDPRPFRNIEAALTRRVDGGPPLNAAEALDIHAAIAAYTRHAAVVLGQAERSGTITAGKQADLIVLDRNIVELAERGRSERIGGARVLLTLVGGRPVHRDPPFIH